MSVEANKSVVRRFTDEGLFGKPEVFDEICSPDFVNHAAPSRTGIQGLKDVVAFSKRAQPDQHWSQLHIIAEGDLVVLYGVREATWQAPEFRGYPTSHGIRIAVELAHMFRVIDERSSNTGQSATISECCNNSTPLRHPPSRPRNPEARLRHPIRAETYSSAAVSSAARSSGRMIIQHTVTRRRDEYTYFFRYNRQQGRLLSPYVNIAIAEQAVERYYATVSQQQITDALATLSTRHTVDHDADRTRDAAQVYQSCTDDQRRLLNHALLPPALPRREPHHQPRAIADDTPDLNNTSPNKHDTLGD